MSEKIQGKKRIQVNVPMELSKQSQEIFNELGLTTQAAMTIFLKKVVATKGLPFSMKLSGSAASAENLADAVSKLPVKELKDKKAVEEWMLQGDDYYE